MDPHVRVVHELVKEQKLNSTNEADLKLKLDNEQYKVEMERLASERGPGGAPAVACSSKGERRASFTWPSVSEEREERVQG